MTPLLLSSVYLLFSRALTLLYLLCNLFLPFCRDFGSLANLVKSAAGTGLFAMPNAFACVGIFIGILGTAFMGLLIAGSLQLLVRIHHMMCVRLRKPILVYDEVVVATLTTDVRKPWLSARAATFVNFSNRVIPRWIPLQRDKMRIVWYQRDTKHDGCRYNYQTHYGILRYFAAEK